MSDTPFTNQIAFDEFKKQINYSVISLQADESKKVWVDWKSIVEKVVLDNVSWESHGNILGMPGLV